MVFPLVRKIRSEIKELDEIPLFGKAPSFDWPRFSSLISSRFGLSALTISARDGSWVKEPSELNISLMLNCSFSLAPIRGSCFWIMSKEDIARLTSWMLTGKSKGKALTAELLQEGFYRYLLLEALDCMQGMEPLNLLTLQLQEDASLPEEALFCIEVEISFDGKSCWGKLVIPSSCRQSWVAHFSHLPEERISMEMARRTELDLSVTAGSVLLSQEEWGSIEPGDFVRLDRAGPPYLVLGQTQLFKVQVHPHQMELSEYAFYPEAQMKTPSEEEVKAIKELPLTVVAEIARVRISLEKLMQLQPGNLLDIAAYPGQSVVLTVNGQCVGRAELIQVGDVLGLRILEVGS